MANNRRGIISVLAMVFLCLFASLAVAYCSAVNMSVVKADNQRYVQNSLMEAESGLGFYLYLLRNMNLSGNPTDQAMLDATKNALAAHPSITGNGVTIGYDNTTITLGAISCGDGGSFSAAITRSASTTLHVLVTGTRGGISRQVAVDLNLASGTSPVLNYGIATKSPISLTGNTVIKGANNAAEASLLSETAQQTAVTLNGNLNLQGEVNVGNPLGQVTLIGNPTIGGDTGANVNKHIHIGVGGMDFPTVDQTVFEPFATNNVTTAVNANKTLTNIRIKAGVNPTFSGNTTIKGVVYIEKPNKVTFTGNLNLTGVIVTDDAGTGNSASNYIKFNGNNTFKGVESLDNSDPSFATLKTKPGAAILAPGFGLTFNGNFGTVNGTMAADAYSFVGNCTGTVYGSIINYSDTTFTVTGNSSLTINRSKYTNGVPGLSGPAKFSPDCTSYREY